MFTESKSSASSGFFRLWHSGFWHLSFFLYFGFECPFLTVYYRHINFSSHKISGQDMVSFASGIFLNIVVRFSK